MIEVLAIVLAVVFLVLGFTHVIGLVVAIALAVVCVLALLVLSRGGLGYPRRRRL
jgi:uncharacterized membrane protein